MLNLKFESFTALILISFIVGILGSSAKDYQEVGLQLHNEYRAMHNAGPMKLDSTLNEKADKCAEYYISIGYIDHSCEFRKTSNYPRFMAAGENLYWQFETDIDEVSAVKEAVKLWYGESEDYDFTNNRPNPGKDFSDIGHFTQLIWRASRDLGIGFSAVNETGVCVVGLYGPHGNVVGEILENVLPDSHNYDKISHHKHKGKRLGGRAGGMNDDGNEDDDDDEDTTNGAGRSQIDKILSIAIIFGFAIAMSNCFCFK